MQVCILQAGSDQKLGAERPGNEASITKACRMSSSSLAWPHPVPQEGRGLVSLVPMQARVRMGLGTRLGVW